jgi:cell division protease FtsH
MVTIYGLNDKIGNISFYDSSGQQEYAFNKPYSEKTAELIDQEVKLMIDKAYERTKKLLTDHKDQLTQLAQRLLEKEVLFKEDLQQIFGKRKWEDKQDLPSLNSNGNGNGSAQELPPPAVSPVPPTETGPTSIA